MFDFNNTGVLDAAIDLWNAIDSVCPLPAPPRDKVKFCANHGLITQSERDFVSAWLDDIGR